VDFERFGIPRLKKFAGKFLILVPKQIFLQKNPIRCDFLQFRMATWLE